MSQFIHSFLTHINYALLFLYRLQHQHPERSFHIFLPDKKKKKKEKKKKWLPSCMYAHKVFWLSPPLPESPHLSGESTPPPLQKHESVSDHKHILHQYTVLQQYELISTGRQCFGSFNYLPATQSTHYWFLPLFACDTIHPLTKSNSNQWLPFRLIPWWRSAKAKKEKKRKKGKRI